MTNNYQQLLTQVLDLAKQAGKAILTVYNQEQALSITKKADHTPVTEADIAAHDVIVKGLQTITPNIPILSEEDANIPYQSRKSWHEYWLVDPLDGTKEFIKGNGEFTVNIALISGNKSILGVIYAPVLDVSYYATTDSNAFKQQGEEAAQVINVNPLNSNHIKIAGSRSHGQKQLQNFLQQFKNCELITMGSSLKSCLVAEGSADIYPRLGPTSEWDTAAAQCIVEQAGGFMLDLEGQDLRYNCKDSLINPWFIVAGDKKVHWLKYFQS